jgi:signal transduction histidine kinase
VTPAPGPVAHRRALARRSAVPVELDLRTGRPLPDQVEVAAYYAVSEALANPAKHARAVTSPFGGGTTLLIEIPF